MSYKHINLEERERLYALKGQGLSLRDIAKELKRSQSSLTRELQRNIKYGNEYLWNEYIPCKAQALAEKRAKKQRYKAPLKEPAIFLYVRKQLRKEGWSPETIAGRLPIDHPGLSICHETIYQYIYSKKTKTRGMHLEQYLTLKRKKRMKQDGRSVQRHSKISEAVSIDLRPKAVAKRKQIGHWETDNVIGKQTDKTALSVTVERVMHITLINKLHDRSAATKTLIVGKRLNQFPDKSKKTLTADNGSENSKHKELTALTAIPVFFCHPYHSWERGTVENTNGIIRRYIPKGVSIDTISDEYIAALEYKLNSTPRKCLQYLTPYEMMAKLHVTTTE
ncbi:MAG: IS30 family transposase [Candidatus Levyibacteriota bacterium]